MFLDTTKGNKRRCHQDQKEEEGNNFLQWGGPMWFLCHLYIMYSGKAIIVILTLEMAEIIRFIEVW